MFLHGKRSDPSTDQNRSFVSEMKNAGFKVIAPVMPWSEKRGYDGKREQDLEVVTEAAKAVGEDKAVVIGHSMGAMAALQYGAAGAAGAATNVVGIISFAAGHDPNNSGKIRQRTREAAS